MKFYEFKKGYEYYAMLYAINEEEAIKGYVLEISDIDEEKELKPSEITKEQALTVWLNSGIEGCNTVEAKEEKFYKTLDDFMRCRDRNKEKYLIMLIDSRLY